MNLRLAEQTPLMRMAVLGCDYITALGLSQLLDSVDFIDVRGAVSDAAEANSLLDAEHVDLVLIHAAMPADVLIHTCKSLGGRKKPPTLVVMGELPFETSESLVFAGVSAILDHGLIGEDLPAVLRMIHRGGALLLSNTARDALLTRNTSADLSHRERFEGLNARERIVAHGVAEGHTNVQLAARMHMSEATVKLLVSNVMNKLGVTNRVQIAVIVTKARAI